MIEDFLDEADVGSVVVHERRHCVAEEMTRAGLAGLRSLDPGLHIRGHTVAAERLPAGREEEGRIVRLGYELRTRFVEVLLHPLCGVKLRAESRTF